MRMWGMGKKERGVKGVLLEVGEFDVQPIGLYTAHVDMMSCYTGP